MERVETTRQQVAALREQVKSLTDQRDKLRSDQGELMTKTRELRGRLNELHQKSDAAWDEVRRAVFTRSGQEAISKAAKAARSIDDEHGVDREKLQAAIRQQDDLYKKMSDSASQVQEVYREKSAALRTLERDLRELERINTLRDGWYEDYLAEVQRRKQRDAEAELRRLEKEAQEAEREREKQAARKRYIAMPPEERANEESRLQSEIDRLNAEYEKQQAAEEANRAQSKTMYEKREAIRSEMRALADEVRSAWNRYHEVRKSGADKEALDQAKAAASALEDEKEPKREALREAYEQVEAQRDESAKALYAIRDKRSAIANERYFAERFKRHVTAPIRHNEVGDAPIEDLPEVRAQRREKARDAKRKAWVDLTGKDVEWGDNPYAGGRVRLSGGIANGNARFQVLHDCPAYHSLFDVVGDQRQLVVIDPQGQVVFAGPVTHVQDRKDLTLDLYYLWEFLDGQVSLDIK